MFQHSATLERELWQEAHTHHQTEVSAGKEDDPDRLYFQSRWEICGSGLPGWLYSVVGSSQTICKQLQCVEGTEK